MLRKVVYTAGIIACLAAMYGLGQVAYWDLRSDTASIMMPWVVIMELVFVLCLFAFVGAWMDRLSGFKQWLGVVMLLSSALIMMSVPRWFFVIFNEHASPFGLRSPAGIGGTLVIAAVCLMLVEARRHPPVFEKDCREGAAALPRKHAVHAVGILACSTAAYQIIRRDMGTFLEGSGGRAFNNAVRIIWRDITTSPSSVILLISLVGIALFVHAWRGGLYRSTKGFCAVLLLGGVSVATVYCRNDWLPAFAPFLGRSAWLVALALFIAAVCLMFADDRERLHNAE
jgi:hypothetical protein